MSHKELQVLNHRCSLDHHAEVMIVSCGLVIIRLADVDHNPRRRRVLQGAWFRIGYPDEKPSGSGPDGAHLRTGSGVGFDTAVPATKHGKTGKSLRVRMAQVGCARENQLRSQ